ncbi:MAG: ABC transporter permease, partial [Actinomycetia bacterium]|nr:ABC transporter permease [Actinomycetes bacterium]
MAYILKLAWRNIRRNKKRSALSITAVLFAVMMVAFFQGYVNALFGNWLENSIKMDSGHVKIQNREFTRYEKIIPLDLNIDGFQRGKAVQGGGGFREIIEAIETDKELSGKLDIITPRSKFGVLLNYNGNNFFAFGKIVDFEKEERIQEISKFIVGGRLPTAKKEMVIGIRLAEKLDLKINDKLTMMTKTQYNSLGMRTFRITGLLKTGMGLIDKKVFY